MCMQAAFLSSFLCFDIHGNDEKVEEEEKQKEEKVFLDLSINPQRLSTMCCGSRTGTNVCN